MKTNKLIFECLRIILVLIIWFVLVYIGFNFSQGLERTYVLGNDYEIFSWPGYIVRWNVDASVPLDVPNYKKVIEERITAFYVNSIWIVAKTQVNWLAINKKTHEVHYPYKSHKELCDAIGFSFSPDNLITRRPLSYEKIYPETKRFVWIMIILLIIPLIGFRRTVRILKFPFKQAEKIIKKI